MYAIKKGKVEINNVQTDTFEREVLDGKTTLRVQAGTTGYKGGGRDAGGRTYICIHCFSGDFYFRPVRSRKGKLVGMEVATCGDEGLDAIIRALEFVCAAIDDMRCGENA